MRICIVCVCVCVYIIAPKRVLPQYHVYTHSERAFDVYIYAEVNYEMPEEFNEMLILIGKLVGSKSQTKTIQRWGGLWLASDTTNTNFVPRAGKPNSDFVSSLTYKCTC